MEPSQTLPIFGSTKSKGLLATSVILGPVIPQHPKRDGEMGVILVFFSLSVKVLGPFGEGVMGFWGRSDFSIGTFPAYLATQCHQNHFAR